MLSASIFLFVYYHVAKALEYQYCFLILFSIKYNRGLKEGL